jgi:hypothetical protein
MSYQPPLPEFYLIHRKTGDHHWSAPVSFSGQTSVREAHERAAHLVKYEVDEIERGKMYEFRFYRSGVCVDVWREDGR